MSYFNYSWRFFTRRKNTNKINYSTFIPIIGTAIGTSVIIITLAVMNGIEEDIFNSLKSFSGTTIKVNDDFNDPIYSNIYNILNENNISYLKYNERKVLLENNGDYKIIQIRSIENIENFIASFDDLDGKKSDYTNYDIILGKDLAYRLNISINDSILMFSPLDTKIINGFVPRKAFNVSTIYTTKLLDFDANYAFVNFESVSDIFLQSPTKGIYLSSQISKNITNKIISLNNKIEINPWNDLYKNLINAMKLEKIAYVSFGILVILMAIFSVISLMSFTVLQKKTQIGILKTIGYQNYHLKKMFLIFGLISGIIGSIIGLILANIFIEMEESYSLVYRLLGNNPYLIFPIKNTLHANIIIPIFTTITITFSAYIPAKKLILIDPVKIIGMQQ